MLLSFLASMGHDMRNGAASVRTSNACLDILICTPSVHLLWPSSPCPVSPSPALHRRPLPLRPPPTAIARKGLSGAPPPQPWPQSFSEILPHPW